MAKVKSNDLLKFASTVFFDGKPLMTLRNLETQLRSKSWVTWDGKPATCPECYGQDFPYEVDESWTCHGILRLQQSGGHTQYVQRSCRSRACSAQLAVGRFQCKNCKLVNFCEDCMTTLRLPQAPPVWTRIPARFVPIGLEKILCRVATFVHSLRLRLDRFRDTAFVKLLKKGPGDKRAFFVYQFCVLCSLLLAAFHFLMARRVYFMLEWMRADQFFWLFCGTTVFFVYSPPGVRVIRRLRALWNCHVYSQRRAQGGPVERWAFFEADEHVVNGEQAV